MQLGSELDPQHLALVQWPTLQELTLRHDIKEWHLVTFPRLQSLTLGGHFNRSLEGATLPESLRCLSLGDEFNQSLEGVAWSCHCLAFQVCWGMVSFMLVIGHRR